MEFIEFITRTSGLCKYGISGLSMSYGLVHNRMALNNGRMNNEPWCFHFMELSVNLYNLP